MHRNSLLEAFSLRNSKVIAIVGGGGKSSLMAALGNEYHYAGETAVMTTTTHIFHPQRNAYLGDDPAVFSSLLEQFGLLTVGVPIEDGRLGASPLLEQLPRLAQHVLIEADGTKGLPLKVPRENEPVIPEFADTIVAVAGLSALGRPLGEVCHRAELAAGVYGYSLEQKVTPQMLAEMISSPVGQQKGVGSRRFRVLLNQCDAVSREVAFETAKALNERGVRRVVVGALQAAPDNITVFIR